MREELYLNGNLHAEKIIEKLSKEKYARIKKLSFIAPNLKLIDTISDLLSKFSLTILCVCRSTEHDVLFALMDSINGHFLQKIDLQRCCIGTSEITAILTVATTSPITKLAFSACTFQNDALSVILAAVQKSTVCALALIHTEFTDGETNAIIDMISSNTLIKLSLNYSSFSHDQVPNIMQAVHNSSLQNFDARQTSLFNNVSDVAKLIEHVNIFKFDQSTFDIEEQIAIINVMMRNSSFVYAHFDCTNISNDLLDAMCNLLENSSLTKLDLKYDAQPRLKCGAQSRKIIDAIKKSHITSLKLTTIDNKLISVDAICDLIENHILVKLNLYCCSMTDKTIRSMLPFIKKSSLTKFNSYFGSVTKDTLVEIDEALIAQKKISNRFNKMKSAAK